MTYVDTKYISIARKNEVEHHEHVMEQLHAKIAWLTKSLAWELEQHHSRMKELQEVEDTLAIDTPPILALETQPILESSPSAPRRKTKSKKRVHRFIEEPIAQLVG